MADGDFFCWKLRGPGSRKFVDLARSGASPNTIYDQAMNMVVRHIREKELGACLRGMAEEIRLALLTGPANCKTFERLRRSLERHTASQGTDEGLIAAKSGERVFTKLELRGGSFSLNDIQLELLGAFAIDLVGQHALAPSRDVLMKESGRDIHEQFEWESRLNRDLEGRIAPLCQSLFDGSNRPVRTPRKRTKQRKMTLEELHAPLQISASQ